MKKHTDIYLARITIWVIVFFLANACGSDPEPVSYANIIDNCIMQMRSQTGSGEDYQALLDRCGPDCVIGSVCPIFSDTTISGKQIDSQYFKNKINIINFWFINCPPCVAEIPGLNHLQQKYGAESINFLSISRDKPDKIQAFIKKKPYYFDIVADGDSLVQNHYKIMWPFPLTLVTDKNRVIIGAFVGGPTDSTASDAVIRKLEPLIQKQLEN